MNQKFIIFLVDFIVSFFVLIACNTFKNIIINNEKGLMFVVPEIVFAFFILGFVLWVLWLKYQNIVSKNILFEKLFLYLVLYLGFVYLNNNIYISKLLFNCTFLVDLYSITFKVLIVLSSLCLIVFTRHRKSYTFYKNDWLNYSIMWLLAVFFMVLLCGVFDLILFYIVIEGLSLSLYVLAGLFVKQINLGTEAVTKYFVLGLLASGFFSFGISLIYVEIGETSFYFIKQFFLEPKSHISLLTYIGLLSILYGFFFKLSAAPCNVWAPDVYEGITTPVTAFLAITVKLSIFAVFIRMFFFAFFELFYFWQYFLIISSILSMVIGCFGALKQQKIKRLMAYASINQIGYIFMGLSCGTLEGIQSAFIYLFLYIIMLIIFFGLLLNIQSSCFAGTILYVSELNSLFKNDPMCALVLFVVLLSMAGIPPLGGFLGKYYLFVATIHSALYFLTLIGLLISVVSIFYYLRLIRSAIFENTKNIKLLAFNKNKLTIFITGFFSIYLICWMPVQCLLNLMVFLNILEIQTMLPSVLFILSKHLTWGVIAPFFLYAFI